MILPAQLEELDRVLCELDDLRPRACITASAWGECALVRDGQWPMANGRTNFVSSGVESRHAAWAEQPVELRLPPGQLPLSNSVNPQRRSNTYRPSSAGPAHVSFSAERQLRPTEFNLQPQCVSSAGFSSPTSLALAAPAKVPAHLNGALVQVNRAPAASLQPAPDCFVSSSEVVSPSSPHQSPPGGLDVRQAFPRGRWTAQPTEVA